MSVEHKDLLPPLFDQILVYHGGKIASGPHVRADVITALENNIINAAAEQERAAARLPKDFGPVAASPEQAKEVTLTTFDRLSGYHLSRAAICQDIQNAVLLTHTAAEIAVLLIEAQIDLRSASRPALQTLRHRVCVRCHRERKYCGLVSEFAGCNTQKLRAGHSHNMEPRRAATPRRSKGFSRGPAAQRDFAGRTALYDKSQEVGGRAAAEPGLPGGQSACCMFPICISEETCRTRNAEVRPRLGRRNTVSKLQGRLAEPSVD